MKFALTIPDRILPKSWRTETKAVAKVEKAMAQGKKRVSINLTQRRQFIASMKQDELKMAIFMAEDTIRPRRTLLNEYYRQTLKDGHIFGEYEKAINKVVGSPFAIFRKG